MKWKEMRERQQERVIEHSRKAQEPTRTSAQILISSPYFYAFIY